MLTIHLVPVLVFGERRLLLLGPAAQGLLDIHSGLLVPCNSALCCIIPEA